jgi:hypothetical protein
MRTPFNSGADPTPPRFSTPGPGEYEPKHLPYPPNIRSIFASRTPRDIYRPPVDTAPPPTAYAHLADWTPEPPPPPPPPAGPDIRATSGFIGQNILGYHQDIETGDWLPIQRYLRDTEDIGPGSYDPRILERGNPAVSMEMAANRDLYGCPPENPGPGAYSPMIQDLRIPPEIGRKIETKPAMSTRTIHTGPRVWSSLANETNAVFKNKAERPLFPRIDPTPDPGHYDPQLPLSHKAGDLSEFGVHARLEDRVPDEVPGPGSYELPGRWIKSGKPTVRKAIDRERISKSVPGPGSYDPVTKVETRPNSMFVSRSSRTEKVGTIAPGPGNYNPTDMDSFGTMDRRIHSSRFESHGDWIQMSLITTPAPDSYQEIATEPGIGKTIPKSPRFPPVKINRVPGPGAYEVGHASFLRKSYNSSIPDFGTH